MATYNILEPAISLPGRCTRVSDGLLSNFNLIMGIAGAEMSSKAILLTGFAGLLAGGIR